METPIILWFRQDLRLEDLPSLRAAARTGRPIIPCFVLDDDSPGRWRQGSASRWWLHHSLQELAKDIRSRGGNLLLFRGSATEVLPDLAAVTGADSIICSRQYEPWVTELESQLRGSLSTQGVKLACHPGSLLFEPAQIRNTSGRPFKVFTPFWRHCQRQPEPARPRGCPTGINWQQPRNSDAPAGALELEQLELTSTISQPCEDWTTLWQPGSAGARKRLKDFLAQGMQSYQEGRDQPALGATSRLSAHLHFGELSPGQVWHLSKQAAGQHPQLSPHVDKFLAELGWREFSSHLLSHYPTIDQEAFKEAFREFPWLAQPGQLKRWQQGQTGYPIVDAGMRELWHTGFMHNRVRMVCASFLTKHLLVPWQSGAEWFWEHLLDADLANNSGGWQWVAGSGADAAPYFRIFNPVAQGQKFDSDGEYTRRWVPELATLPSTYLHRPWEAPQEILERAGVTLGASYPLPLVDHRMARESALAAYASVR